MAAVIGGLPGFVTTQRMRNGSGGTDASPSWDCVTQRDATRIYVDPPHDADKCCALRRSCAFVIDGGRGQAAVGVTLCNPLACLSPSPHAPAPRGVNPRRSSIPSRTESS